MWRITTKRVFRLRRRSFVIFKPFEGRARALSPLAPVFRVFQAISTSSTRSILRANDDERLEKSEPRGGGERLEESDPEE